MSLTALHSFAASVSALDLDKNRGVPARDMQRIKAADSEFVIVRGGHYGRPDDNYTPMYSKAWQKLVNNNDNLGIYLSTVPPSYWKRAYRSESNMISSIVRSSLGVLAEKNRAAAFDPQIKLMEGVLGKLSAEVKGKASLALGKALFDFRGKDPDAQLQALDMLCFFGRIPHRNKATMHVYAAAAYKFRIAQLRKDGGSLEKAQCTDKGDPAFTDKNKIKEYEKMVQLHLAFARSHAFGETASTAFTENYEAFVKYWDGKDVNPKERGMALLRSRARGIYEYKSAKGEPVRFEDPLFMRTVSFGGTIPGALTMLAVKEPEKFTELIPNKFMFMTTMPTVGMSPVGATAKALYIEAARLADSGCELEVKEKPRRRYRPRRTGPRPRPRPRPRKGGGFNAGGWG